MSLVCFNYMNVRQCGTCFAAHYLTTPTVTATLFYALFVFVCFIYI